MDDTNLYPTYWCTRDEGDDGKLSDSIDVWLARPVRQNLPGGGAMWLGAGDTGLEHRFAVWTVAMTLVNCRTYPETSRECLRVGEEPTPVKDS